jgi:hypothetical protein
MTEWEESEMEKKEETKEEAKGWLGLVRKRSGSEEVELEVKCVRECAKEAGIDLEAIGTSEEELQELLRRGYEAEARNLLRFARKFGATEVLVNQIQYYVRMAEITLEDIGTSEEELKRLLGKKRESKVKSVFKLFLGLK